MPDLLMARVFFSLTLLTIGINVVGWYGLWGYYAITLKRGKSGSGVASPRLKVLGVITPVIRLEFAYYLLLLFYQFLANSPLSAFWVIFMFLYHFLGLWGNEHYRRGSNLNGRSRVSKRKVSILLSSIVTLDLVEFYALITFLHQLYLLSAS
jgi:hypothetical protein